MKNFKQGGGFKKSFGGRPSFGGGSRFGGDRHGGGRPEGREFKQMYQATCADCGKSCEVPFRPTGERPVYCRDCFAKNAPASPRDGGFKKPFNKFEHRDAGHRPSFRPEPSFAPRGDTAQSGELMKQFEMLNTKMDRLIGIIEKQGKGSVIKEALKSIEMPVLKPESKSASKPARKTAKKAAK